MVNENDLDELDIQTWSAIAAGFREADLLLGNGFSVSITPRLDYRSLFDRFLGECSIESRNIFTRFETSNFELILQKLSDARDVDRIFGIRAERIEDAADELKDGLIRTIQGVHPRWTETDEQQLERIALKIDEFDDVFTLNYDLYLYRVILILKDRLEARRRDGENVREYSDYFWQNYDTQFLRFDSDPSHDFHGYRHQYYLHGALFLFKEPSYDYDLKLRRAESREELIEVISKNIKAGRMPLFVSEGTPEQKEQAISRSEYLTFARKRLAMSDKALVIFGTSLSDSDRHIVNAINQNKRELAVSIHIGTKLKDEVKTAEHLIRSKFPRHELVFFDSSTLFAF